MATESRRHPISTEIEHRFSLNNLKPTYHYFITHLFPFCLFSLIAVTYLRNLDHLIPVIAVTSVHVIRLAVHHMTHSKPIYLVDYSCFRPPDHMQLTRAEFMNLSKHTGAFTQSSLDFQTKILERSGVGDATYMPAALLVVPAVPSIATARQEAEQVMFGALDSLFKSTKTDPKDVGVVVVNCSLFNPIPSLSSMIVNKYKLNENVKTFNLSGMGCSAGVIAIDLAKNMLKVHGNTYAVVVTTENITENWYYGNKKSMLVSNCLFRVGGSAVLLSNKCTDKRRSKYKLVHVVRTNYGFDDTAFKCAFQEEDEAGNIGFSLSKELKTVAGDALKLNMNTLGKLVLPISEKVRFVVNYLSRKIISKLGNTVYVPDFKTAFDHFCIHAGGRGVIDEMAKNLRLSEEHVEPSRKTLNRFGNTSSSSIWYELAYTEAKGRMKKGDRIWQIALGSGFKCNSAVWEAIQTVTPSAHNPWTI